MNRLVITIGISLLASGAQARNINLNSAPFPGINLEQIKNLQGRPPVPVSDVEIAGPRVTLLLNADRANQLSPVWPGFSVFGQPVLLYEAGVRSFLIAHPAPPAGYEPVFSSPQAVFAKQGAVPGLNFTFNFHFPVNGVDSFGYRYDSSRDPAQDVRTIVHERFHVYQQTGFKRVKYSPRTSEPDAEDLALAALEQKTLKSAIKAGDPAEAARYARQFLAVRAARYARLPDSLGQEDAEERSEGMALYLDHLLMNRPEVAPVPGYVVSDISRRLDRFPDISDMDKPRYYGTGAAQGLLLDAASADWKARVAAGSSLREELSLAFPSPGNAASLLAEAKTLQDYDGLLRTGVQKAADFQKAKAAAIADYENSPGIEWSVPAPRSLGFSAKSPDFSINDFDTLMPKLQVLDANETDFSLHLTDRPTILGARAIRFHSEAPAVTLNGQPFTLQDDGRSYRFESLSVTDPGLNLSISSPGRLTVTGSKAVITYR